MCIVTEAPGQIGAINFETPQGLSSVPIRLPGDLEVNQGHAMAGIKQAFIRHMVTRYGKENTGGEAFPEITILRGGDDTEREKWKKRFAKAVINYVKLYDDLEKQTKKFRDSLDKDNKSIIFNYENAFVGTLYRELKESYGGCLTQKDPEQCIVSKLLSPSPTQ